MMTISSIPCVLAVVALTIASPFTATATAAFLDHHHHRSSSSSNVAFRRVSQPSSPRTMASSSQLNMAEVAGDAKVVLVTGSSRGLGRSIALEMGRAGQKVVVNYVSDGSKEAAAATVEEIKALGGDAIAVQADSACPISMYLWLCVCVFSIFGANHQNCVSFSHWFDDRVSPLLPVIIFVCSS
jgi:short chain dehydrogenase